MSSSHMTETREMRRDDIAVVHEEHGHTWMRTAGRAMGATTGIVLIVMGAVALIRTGLPLTPDALTAEHVEVGWLHHTTLLGLIHLVLGASLVSAVGYGTFGASAMTAGVVTLVLGVIVWIEPTSLHGAFATHRVHGVTYGLAGLSMMLASWLISRSTVVTTRQVRA